MDPGTIPVNYVRGTWNPFYTSFALWAFHQTILNHYRTRTLEAQHLFQLKVVIYWTEGLVLSPYMQGTWEKIHQSYGVRERLQERPGICWVILFPSLHLLHFQRGSSSVLIRYAVIERLRRWTSPKKRNESYWAGTATAHIKSDIMCSFVSIVEHPWRSGDTSSMMQLSMIMIYRLSIATHLGWFNLHFHGVKECMSYWYVRIITKLSVVFFSVKKDTLF